MCDPKPTSIPESTHGVTSATTDPTYTETKPEEGGREVRSETRPEEGQRKTALLIAAVIAIVIVGIVLSVAAISEPDADWRILVGIFTFAVVLTGALFAFAL